MPNWLLAGMLTWSSIVVAGIVIQQTVEPTVGAWGPWEVLAQVVGTLAGLAVAIRFYRRTDPEER